MRILVSGLLWALLALPAAGAVSPREAFERGRDLEGRGRLAEAGAAYLEAFDSGAGDMAFFAQRLTVLLERLAAIAEARPDVRDAIARRRATLEARLLAGEAGFEAATDLGALDQALGRPSDTLATYDRLVDAGIRGEATSVLFNLVTGELLAQKRYATLVAGDDLLDRLRTRIALYGRTADLLSAGEQDEERTAELRSRLVEEGCGYYEALLGAGRREEAEEAADLLLEVVPGTWTRAALDAHALRAGRSDEGAPGVR